MEEWRPVDLVPGYEVSNYGRVRSANGVLKLQISKKGYAIAELWQHNHRRRTGVHRLVARAFLPGPELPEVNHKDWDKLNNQPSNLEWSTGPDNIAHGMTQPDKQHFWVSSPHYSARREQWRWMREQGFTLKQIGALYGVTKQAVHKVLAKSQPPR